MKLGVNNMTARGYKGTKRMLNICINCAGSMVAILADRLKLKLFGIGCC